MLIGVDFDNTIVCYDRLFHLIAVEQGLIPAEVQATKGAVRDYLRACGREDAWTELQGTVYGARMTEADPFPGVLAFFQRCRARGVGVAIISHKTRHPFRGPNYDLHQAAQGWLARYSFYDPAGIGLRADQVYFELTKREKLARIAALGCSHFIDDLPELLAEREFPAPVERLLFDPGDSHQAERQFRRITSWAELTETLLC